jgi:hypothetical protein
MNADFSKFFVLICENLRESASHNTEIFIWQQLFYLSLRL